MPPLLISQPPFNTSLMGVLRGVCDYYGFAHSDAKLYGGSGHAFLMNVHDQVCPSGPYCWNYSGFYPLVANLGLRMEDLGFFHNGSTAEERAGLEEAVRERLSRGEPCAMCNMDNQIIVGFDDEKFHATQPWGPECGVTPARLSFGTWAEFGSEVHVNFFAFSKIVPVSEDNIFVDSLRFAIDLHRNPTHHTEERYAVGSGAYDNWIGALRTDQANHHGNWWNATVWS